MLKIFDKLEDVPEGLREHYKLIEGKYVPEVADEHPLIANNRKLLNEKNAAETKASGLETTIAGLKADVESAKASGLPRGHVAVQKSEAEAMNSLKEYGTTQEIAAKLTEHSTLKEESTKRARQDSLRAVAKDLGYNADAFVLLPGLPDEFEKRKGTDGKETWIAKIKDAAGTITERPAQEFIESNEGLKPLLPALKVSAGGIPVPGGPPDRGQPSGNFFDDIRKDVKASEEANKANSLPLGQRRGITEIGAATV